MPGIEKRSKIDIHVVIYLGPLTDWTTSPAGERDRILRRSIKGRPRADAVYNRPLLTELSPSGLSPGLWD